MALPPLTGPDPSTQVAAFYYPWYGNLAVDGAWIHWDQNNHQPPRDIGSDYMPALGAYSSNDPAVVAQHMAWLRQAGVGVIIVSWWGQGSREERPVPLILQMARRYGIKLAFHIEPYSGRTADSLLSDVKYLYAHFGSDPAFFLSTAASRYSPGSQPKPMFFVWSAESQDGGNNPVKADYWQKSLDAIHALPQGALVIANSEQGSWVADGHFDGLYNYATLHLDQNGGFAWARSLPPNSLYIPSVIPGFSAQRVGYAVDTLVPRLDGATYADQWSAALGTGVQPELVTVTSFNEWHEGSMIEPPALGANNGQGYTYADFGKLPPDGYLTLTRQWVDKFLGMTWPPVIRVRIQITTTSDWTTLNVLSGGAWLRPELVSADPGLVNSDMENGDQLLLMQSLADAQAGKLVQMTWDVQISGLDPASKLVLEIDRGSIGSTQVAVFNYLGNTPVPVMTFRWGGVTSGRNPFNAEIPASSLLNGPVN
jgi:glycoprotein endo-alpha-1,2-mannosidase